MPRRMVDLRGGDKPLLDIVSYGRSARRSLSPIQRQQIARTVGRAPEVMVKVSGGARSFGGNNAARGFSGGSYGRGANSYGGATTLSGSNFWNVATGSTFTDSGPINGTGSLTKTGIGTFVMGAAGNFSGGLTVSGGLVQVTASSRATPTLIPRICGTVRRKPKCTPAVVSMTLFGPGVMPMMKA